MLLQCTLCAWACPKRRPDIGKRFQEPRTAGGSWFLDSQLHHFPEAAVTIATIPDRRASGSVRQALTTTVRSESSGSARVRARGSAA